MLTLINNLFSNYSDAPMVGTDNTSNTNSGGWGGSFQGGNQQNEEIEYDYDGITLSLEARYWASNQGLENVWGQLAA